MTSTPSVGRMVHYVDENPAACRAATVTEVVAEVVTIRDGTGAIVGSRAGKQTVGLAVLTPTSLTFRPASDGGADFDPGEPCAQCAEDADLEGLCDARRFEPRSWHWPARVDEDTARAAARGGQTLSRR